MTKTISKLADELLETIALEDEAYFQKHGFYTTRTRANECKVLVFNWPEEQRKLNEFYSWRHKHDRG